MSTTTARETGLCRSETTFRGEMALRWTVAGAGLVFLATYLVLAGLRVRYPFELEWMEGASVDHVRRVLSGQRLYVAPSLAWVPFIYTPLYYYVCAGVAKLTGVGFLPLRLVSIAASLACFWLLFALARRETERVWVGLLAVGFFAATYRLSGVWWDVGRVDNLMLALVFFGIWLHRRSPRPLCQVAAGLVLCLAYLTKQQALIVAIFLLCAAVFVHRRGALWFAGALLLPSLGSYLFLNRLSDGWYSYYTLWLPSHHELIAAYYVAYWFEDLLPTLAPVMILERAFPGP